MTKEKEKILSDLFLVNERSAALAVEIDEQTAEQDILMRSKIEVLLLQEQSPDSSRLFFILVFR